MDPADFASRAFSGRRREPEKLAERLPPAQSRHTDDATYAAGLVDEARIALSREPQRIRSERIGLTG